MIKVFVADDHAVVREGIKRILAEAGDITVAGEAASGPELLARACTGSCDVVVMDLAMPGCSGLEALQEFRRLRPRVPILVLSMYPEDQYAVRTITAGATGYLNKSGMPEELVKAVRTLAAGRRYISPEVAEHLASHVDQSSGKAPHEALSNREYQVMCMLAAGRSVSEISQELCLSVKTVSTYRSRILEKMGFHCNAELIRYAIQNQIVD